MDTNYHDCCKIFNKRAYDLFENWSRENYGKMSQPKVVAFTGIPQAIISKIKTSYENPKEKQYQPPAETICKIAKAFNVSTDYLLGLAPEKTTDKATKELCLTLGLSEDSINLLLKNTPLYFEEWEKADSVNTYRIAQTVMILDALLKDHIDYLTNKDNRNAEDKHSLLMLLYSYLEHTALSGSATVHSVDEFLSIDDVSERISIQQLNESGLFADNLYSFKDLLLAQDIQKITAFLQSKGIKGIDRKKSRDYINKVGGDKQ